MCEAEGRYRKERRWWRHFGDYVLQHSTWKLQSELVSFIMEHSWISPLRRSFAWMTETLESMCNILCPECPIEKKHSINVAHWLTRPPPPTSSCCESARKFKMCKILKSHTELELLSSYVPLLTYRQQKGIKTRVAICQQFIQKAYAYS